MKLHLKNNKFILEFDYDPDLVARVRDLPAAKWNKTAKVWEFPATAKMYDLIKQTFNISNEEVEKLLVEKLIDLGKHKFKVSPFAHQVEAIKFILKHFGFGVKSNE